MPTLISSEEAGSLTSDLGHRVQEVAPGLDIRPVGSAVPAPVVPPTAAIPRTGGKQPTDLSICATFSAMCRGLPLLPRMTPISHTDIEGIQACR